MVFASALMAGNVAGGHQGTRGSLYSLVVRKMIPF